MLTVINTNLGWITKSKIVSMNSALAKTLIFPMGIYSNKIKNFADLKEGAIVAIPNDPTNGESRIGYFRKNGLIKLNKEAGLKATAADIVENPKKL